MPRCTVTVRSQEVEAALAAGRKLPLYVQTAILPWFDDQMLKVQAAAQKITPHDKGDLQRGATSKSALVTGIGLVGTVEFGGLAEQYAAYQHDTTGLKHKPGRQDHFLYGRSDSGWGQREPTFQGDFDAKLQKLAESQFDAAIAGARGK